MLPIRRLLPIYPRPDTSRPEKGHKKYPDLLVGLRVERPIQIWCADIPYPGRDIPKASARAPTLRS